MSGEESAKHVKMPQKYCSQKRKNQEFTRNDKWLVIIINSQKNKKKKKKKKEKERSSPAPQFSQILSWLPL